MLPSNNCRGNCNFFSPQLGNMALRQACMMMGPVMASGVWVGLSSYGPSRPECENESGSYKESSHWLSFLPWRWYIGRKEGPPWWSSSEDLAVSLLWPGFSPWLGNRDPQSCVAWPKKKKNTHTNQRKIISSSHPVLLIKNQGPWRTCLPSWRKFVRTQGSQVKFQCLSTGFPYYTLGGRNECKFCLFPNRNHFRHVDCNDVSMPGADIMKASCLLKRELKKEASKSLEGGFQCLPYAHPWVSPLTPPAPGPSAFLAHVPTPLGEHSLSFYWNVACVHVWIHAGPELIVPLKGRVALYTFRYRQLVILSGLLKFSGKSLKSTP